MLRLLLKLWWLRKRRDTQKRDIIVGVYILLIYVCVGVGTYLGFASSGVSLASANMPLIAGLALVWTMIVPDLLPKLVLKNDVTCMDDYLKVRPVPTRTWNRFVLMTNVISLLNYMVPILVLPALVWMSGIGNGLACFLIMVLLSYANSMFITCFRRSTDWFLRLSIISGWILMVMVVAVFLAFTFWAAAWFQFAGMLLLSAAVPAGLMAFMAHEGNYDESRHKATRQYSFGRVSLFNMQFYGVIRAKRLRSMVLIAFLIMLADDYFIAWEAEPGNDLVVIYAVLGIMLPSLALSQWTFGVEANFFQGLMTKPIKVRQLLSNCYYFYIVLSFAASLFFLPIMFIYPDFDLLFLLGALGMALFINLFNLPTCLYSSRIELFGQSFFNTQGANMKINFFALALLIPFAISVGVWQVFSADAWAIMSIALGIISLAVHKPTIAWLSSKFEARRYDRMNEYMK